MKGPESIHRSCVRRPDGAVRRITAVTQPLPQYDADQQVRKVTVLFTAAAANTLESMNWVLVVMHCGMLPSEQDVQFEVTYGGQPDRCT